MDETQGFGAGEDNVTATDEQALIGSVRELQADGPDSTSFWDSIARFVGEQPPSHIQVDEAVRLAKLALAINAGDLVLGKYLSDLRSERRLSRDALALDAGLSPDAIAEVEGSRGSVTAVAPELLARMAVRLGAFKQLFLELVRAAASTSRSTPAPRLTRLDRDSSLLRSERAVRRTNWIAPIDLEEYLDQLSAFFDGEVARRAQP